LERSTLKSSTQAVSNVRGELGVHENFYEPSAESFGQMVTWWIDALDDGAWRYDREAGRWEYNWELVEPKRQLGGLV
jgi:hypothetical protein